MTRGHAGFQPVILLFLASVFWGAATVLNKVLLSSIAPVTLLFIQMLASSAVLLLLCRVLHKELPSGREFLLAAALGLLNPGISYTFSMLGLQRIPAGTASLLWALEPFLILILAHLFLRERATVGAAVTVVTGFAGALLVAGAVGGTGVAVQDSLGVAYMLAAVGLCAIYTVSSRRVGQYVDPLVLTAIQQTAACLWAATLHLALADSSYTSPLAAISLSDVFGAVLTGLLYYAAAYWLYLAALKHVTAALAGASFNLIPLVAIAGAFAFLGERLSGVQMMGALLIIISGATLAWLTSKKGN